MLKGQTSGENGNVGGEEVKGKKKKISTASRTVYASGINIMVLAVGDEEERKARRSHTF